MTSSAKSHGYVVPLKQLNFSSGVMLYKIGPWRHVKIIKSALTLLGRKRPHKTLQRLAFAFDLNDVTSWPTLRSAFPFDLLWNVHVILVAQICTFWSQLFLPLRLCFMFRDWLTDWRMSAQKPNSSGYLERLVTSWPRSLAQLCTLDMLQTCQLLHQKEWRLNFPLKFVTLLQLF